MNRQIDLLKKQEQSSYKSDIELKDSISDPYLAIRIEKYSDVGYEFLIRQLLKNPFLYYVNEPDLKIAYFDDFCIKYNSKVYSLGGLTVTKNLKYQTKKKVFNQYYNNWVKQYEIELFDDLKKLDNISNLSDSFHVKHFKLLTLGLTLLFTLILCLICYPTKNLLEAGFLNSFLSNFHNIISSSKLLTFFMKASVISSIVLSTSLLLYEITSRFLYHRYSNAFSRIEKLIRRIKKKTTKLFKSIKKYYHKQFKSKKVTNYPMDKIYKKEYYLKNIDSLNKKSISKLINLKTIIKRFLKCCYFIFVTTLLINITFIILLIIK